MQPVMGFFVIGFFVAILVGSSLAYRHKREELVHKERMAAIERGVPYPIELQAATPIEQIRRYLLSGMIWLFSGAALFVFVAALAVTLPHQAPTSLQDRQTKIEELRKLGAPEWELRSIYYDRHDPEIPLGLAMVGLIPMGVGLAYLIFFFSERKRISVP